VSCKKVSVAIPVYNEKKCFQETVFFGIRFLGLLSLFLFKKIRENVNFFILLKKKKFDYTKIIIYDYHNKFTL